MNRTVILGWLIAGTLGGALPGFGAEATKRPSSILEGVPGLEKPVTYTETKIALGDLVQKVAADTGVPLTAAKDVADEPVAVVVKELPARELLEEVAGLLDYQWSRRGSEKAPSYQIWQDLASRKRENAARYGNAAELEKQLQQQVRRYVEAAALPPQQLQEAARRARQQLLQITPERRGSFYRSPQAQEWSARVSTALALSQSPVRWALARMLGTISPQQWAIVVREGRPLVFSDRPRPGELLLPADTVRAFRASQPTLYPPDVLISYASPEIEQRTRQQEKDLQSQWAGAAGYQVTISPDRTALETRGSLSITVSAVPTGSEDSTSPAPAQGTPGTSLSLKAEPPDHQQGGPEISDEQLAALEKDPVFGVSKSFGPETRPRLPSPGPGSCSDVNLQRLLPDLARIYGVQFLADAYCSSLRFGGDPLHTTRTATLLALLDRFATPTHHWDRQGNLVRLRSRTWFLDRPREIPLRQVRRWQELCARYGALPLEEWLQSVANLNDQQIRSLADCAREADLPPDLLSVCAAPHGLHLYASLTPEQQEWLAKGQTIAIPQMLPQQRDLFLAAFQEHNRSRAEPLDLAQLSGGSLAVTRYDFVRVTETRDGCVSYSWDPAPAPASAEMVSPSVRVVRPGAAIASRPGGHRAAMTGAEAVSVVRYPVTQVTLHFQYSPERQQSVSITIPSPLPSRVGAVSR